MGKYKGGNRPREFGERVTKMSENQERGRASLTLVYLDGSGNGFREGRCFLIFVKSFMFYKITLKGLLKAKCHFCKIISEKYAISLNTCH